MPSAPLKLVAVRGADGTSSFYEDAGEGYDYRRGDHRTTIAIQFANKLRLFRAGNYKSPTPRSVASVEFLGVKGPPREVWAAGRAVGNISYDAATRRLLIPLAADVNEVVIDPTFIVSTRDEGNARP